MKMFDRTLHSSLMIFFTPKIDSSLQSVDATLAALLISKDDDYYYVARAVHIQHTNEKYDKLTRVHQFTHMHD